MRFLLTFAAVAFAATAAFSAPQTVRGWLVHNPDPAFLDKVLAAAPTYHVNHLELSHDVIMQIDEAVDNPERAKLIESVAQRARAENVDTVVWSHEIATRDRNVVLDPESVAGKAFWESRREAYRRGLKACPSVSGVVLMFGSSPYEVWDRPSTPGQGDGWQRMTMPQRIRFVTDLVQGVVQGEFHKQLFVRDFNHSPKQLAWLTEALRDYPGITVMSKPEPQDFQPYYPNSPILGALGKTPQILELDLNGEYWGQSLIPAVQVDYLRERMRYGIAHGTVGAVARIDTWGNSALDTPSESNLYAYDRLLTSPELSAQAIYDGWLQRRYKLAPGSDAAAHLQAILERTFPVAKQIFYTQGFWTWKDQSIVPNSAQKIDGTIRGKSTAQWDPSAKPMEQHLMHPDRELVRNILAEKQAAIVGAQQNVAALSALKGVLSPKDYDDLDRRLRLTVDWAQCYSAIASAYWRVRLAQIDPRAPEATPALCRTAIESLNTCADTLSKRYPNDPMLKIQATNLKSLAADLGGGETK